MQTLQVELGERSYPIYIGSGLLEQQKIWQSHIAGKQVMIVSNDTIANYFLSTMQNTLRAYQCNVVILPDGEIYKNLLTVNKIFDALIANKHHRNTTLIALGGGVIGDMTGFAAACYQRGVNFIQVPTTLLSQVDSSIGGKTGVNHAQAKNMIGAFHQPQCVMSDINTLQTLAEREFNAGLAEVIKAALIADVNFFNWLEENVIKIQQRDPASLIYMIAQACKIKRDIVMQDEFEISGQRALLNLGHTFGHALEKCLNYTGCLHGEAVAIGMVLAARLSAHLGWIKSEDVMRIINLLQAVNLPTVLPRHVKTDEMLEVMKLDKKIIDNKLRFVLLRSLGNAIIADDINFAVLNDLFSGKF